VHPIIASYLASITGAAPLIREGVRTRPAKNSTTPDVKGKLLDAYEQRLNEVDAKPLDVMFNEGHPFNNYNINGPEDIDMKRMGAHEQMRRVGANGKPSGDVVADRFSYNPNSDRAVLAHELGHAVSAKTKVGSVIRSLRSNPKLAMTIAAASGILPVGAAVLTPGDDDYDEAMLGTLALATPTLIDESLATKNALSMMNSADMRASIGQRGKLAGGLLSYAAAPLIAASLGTAIGNQFDEDVPVQ
tara:strand:- start:2203 stop:2940 length:738 start_codon:yes stop_codon:yes gene_type:complete